MDSRIGLWNEDSGTRMFVSGQNGLTSEKDFDVFERCRADKATRMWQVAGYKQLLSSLRKRGGDSALFKEIISIVRKGISVLCLRFPQNDWPEIHRLRKEEMSRDSDA